MTKSKFPHLFPPLKMIKFNFPSFFRHKKMTKFKFLHFFRPKNWESPNFQAISELIHSEFRTLFGISCYG